MDPIVHITAMIAAGMNNEPLHPDHSKAELLHHQNWRHAKALEAYRMAKAIWLTVVHEESKR